MDNSMIAFVVFVSVGIALLVRVIKGIRRATG
jgi:hypothetical protein